MDPSGDAELGKESKESPEDLAKEHRELLARISLKENKLRNLRLLKSYRDQVPLID